MAVPIVKESYKELPLIVVFECSLCGFKFEKNLRDVSGKVRSTVNVAISNNEDYEIFCSNRCKKEYKYNKENDIKLSKEEKEQRLIANSKCSCSWCDNLTAARKSGNGHYSSNFCFEHSEFIENKCSECGTICKLRPADYLKFEKEGSLKDKLCMECFKRVKGKKLSEAGKKWRETPEGKKFIKELGIKNIKRINSDPEIKAKAAKERQKWFDSEEGHKKMSEAAKKKHEKGVYDNHLKNGLKEWRVSDKNKEILRNASRENWKSGVYDELLDSLTGLTDCTKHDYHGNKIGGMCPYCYFEKYGNHGGGEGTVLKYCNACKQETMHFGSRCKKCDPWETVSEGMALKYCDACQDKTWHFGKRCRVCNPWEIVAEGSVYKYCNVCEEETMHVGNRCYKCNPWVANTEGAAPKYCENCNKETMHFGNRCYECQPWESGNSYEPNFKEGVNECQNHLNCNITYKGECWECYKESFKKETPKFNDFTEKYGGFWQSTYRIQEFTTKGQNAMQKELVEKGITWLVHIRFYIDEQGEIKPLVAGKSGSKLVNVSGIDVNFSENPDHGPARKFLNENSFKWYKDMIIIIPCETEKEAYILESFIQKEYGLFGS